MTLFAEVAVEAGRALGRETFTYSVPKGVDVVPGHRVTVPFGRRTTYGFVVSVDTVDPGVETKAIAGWRGLQESVEIAVRPLTQRALRLSSPPRLKHVTQLYDQSLPLLICESAAKCHLALDPNG